MFPSQIESWSCDDVALWLSKLLSLGQYSDSFKENHIDGTELKTLTSDSLQNDLGVGKNHVAVGLNVWLFVL